MTTQTYGQIGEFNRATDDWKTYAECLIGPMQMELSRLTRNALLLGSSEVCMLLQLVKQRVKIILN